MSIGSSSRSRVAYIAESSYGVTPAEPVFQVMRATSGGLRSTKATAVSNEIRADRNVSEIPLVGIDVTGGYPIELSYGSFDDLLAAALMGSWATDVLKNGVTPQSFTFEETVELGATDSFSRFLGCMVNTLSLAMEARGLVTGNIGIMGHSETLDTAIIDAATYTAPNSKPILTASAHAASLAVAALNPVPIIRALNIEVNNGLRVRPAIGTPYTQEFGDGRCVVTGTLTAYFTSNALYQKVLDHATGAIALTIGAATAEKYTISIPKARFLDGARTIGGNDDDVMAEIPWQAEYDASDECSIKITRAVA